MQVRLKLLAETPQDALAHFVVAVSYSQLGDIASEVAARRATPAPERHRRWQEARAWYGTSLGVLHGMEKAGLLSQANAGAPQEIRQAFARCETELASLGAAAS